MLQALTLRCPGRAVKRGRTVARALCFLLSVPAPHSTLPTLWRYVVRYRGSIVREVSFAAGEDDDEAVPTAWHLPKMRWRRRGEGVDVALPATLLLRSFSPTTPPRHTNTALTTHTLHAPLAFRTTHRTTHRIHLAQRQWARTSGPSRSPVRASSSPTRRSGASWSHRRW